MSTSTSSTLRAIALIAVTLAFVPLLLVHTEVAENRIRAQGEPMIIIQDSKLRHQYRHNQSKTKATTSNVTVGNKIEMNVAPLAIPHRDWLDGCHVPPVNIPEPNQRPTGLVVVLAMAPHDKMVRMDAKQRICTTIPKQIEYFLESQHLDMLFLVQEEQDWVWTVEYFQRCFKLQPHPKRKKAVWHNLDGSVLEAMPFTYQASSNTSSATIYMGATVVQYPKYIENDMSILKKPITPKSCQAPREYIQATRWYTRELLHLGILQEYDFFLKIDTDIIFVDTIPFHILQDMINKNAIFAHTAEYHPRGSKTCAMGIQAAVQNFAVSVQNQTRDDAWKRKMCSTSVEVQRDADLFYTNFIAGKVSFWQSPWILELANFLNEFEEGFFTYRWTDQIFWHMAMGLFVENFQEYVVDYTNLRCMPHPNCWLSSYNFQRFGQNAWHNCNNGGYFLHPKDYRVPNDILKPPTRTSVWNASQLLFRSTYQKDCSGK